MNQTIFTKGKQCAAAPIFEYIIKDEMENAFKLSVPLDVEIGIGNNWLEAH